MELFNLPYSARVNKIVPKNAFDNFTNSKQKKLFSDFISRITWLYKLSPDTVNLDAGEIQEIQIFQIELKIKEEIKQILDIIDKSIPYNIIFIVAYDNEIYFSTSAKHPNPLKEDSAVIDWTFKTGWFFAEENHYNFQLKKGLDSVCLNFCHQLSGQTELQKKTFKELIDYNKLIDSLLKEISKLKCSIANCNQFNQKVHFNLKLKEIERKLKSIR